MAKRYHGRLTAAELAECRAMRGTPEARARAHAASVRRCAEWYTPERRAFAARAAARAEQGPPSSARGMVTSERGERCQSTRHFKVHALEIQNDPDLAPIDKKRLLGAIQAACSLYMNATVRELRGQVLELRGQPRPKPLPAKTRQRIDWHLAQLMKLVARSTPR